MSRLITECGRRDSNPQGLCPPAPKAGASANFATPALELLQMAWPDCMVRNMPPVRNLPPGYTITYPNRAKAGSKATKAIVVLLLIVSVALMLIVTIGGWSKLQGLKPVNLVWCVVYLILAFYIATRWARGLLPIAAALAILLLILTLISGLGLSGTSWFDRSHAGFAAPQSMFGGKGLSPDVLGTVTLLIAPVQVLIIIFSMYGFSQGWNVEVEARIEDAEQRGGKSAGGSPPPEPAAA